MLDSLINLIGTIMAYGIVGYLFWKAITGLINGFRNKEPPMQDYSGGSDYE